MSTFPGFMHEIPKISVDRFDGRNLNSEIFFVSHFHADHMLGLKDPAFHSVLQQRESAFVYCSELTGLFLSQNHLQGLDSKIKILPINKEQVIVINDKHGFLSVTALPAGHCPGSIMFLFNYKSFNYLYTGDIRMTKENILQMKPLREPEGGLKPIETLYLDTTFYHPSYAYFPSRDESISELIRICKSWLDKGDEYVIDLRTPAIVGVEYVLIVLSKEFGQPFHVSDTAFEKYCRIPDLCNAVTKDAITKLHACVTGRGAINRSSFMKVHNQWKEHNVFSVKLCSLSASNFSKEKNLVSYSDSQHLYRLVYSSHSSHCELVEMIETLLPKKIEPCVVPAQCTPEQVVNALQRRTYQQNSRSDSEELPILEFSSYEDDDNIYSKIESDKINSKTVQKQEGNGSNALLTLSKYNVQESSDEDKYSDSDEDELPPFRWDCYYDARKALGFQKKESVPTKRKRLDSN